MGAFEGLLMSRSPELNSCGSAFFEGENRERERERSEWRDV